MDSVALCLYGLNRNNFNTLESTDMLPSTYVRNFVPSKSGATDSCNEVDARLEKSLHTTFGDAAKGIEKIEIDGVPIANTYRPLINLPRRKSRCPVCGTRHRHLVERVLERGQGKILECSWCWKLFNSKGNCG